MKAKLYNITYDISTEDLNLSEEDLNNPAKIHFVKRQIRNELPSELIVDLEDFWTVGDLPAYLSEAISDKTGWLVLNFDIQLF